MSANAKRSPLIRRTFIVLSFLGLVGLFFALNYLLFIPKQQQLYNKKIFRILHEVSEDFKRSLDGKADFIAKNIKQDSAGGTILLRGSDVGTMNFRMALDASFIALDETLVSNATYSRTYTFSTDTVRISIVTADRGTSALRNVKQEAVPIGELLEPNIKNLHNNLFHLVMLVQRDVVAYETNEKERKVRTRDNVLYKLGAMAAQYILPGDTLFRDSRFGQFSAVSEVPIEGTRYKAFALPFQVSGNELILLGFIEAQEYKVATARYSNPSLIGIGSLLLLVILLLPFIKVFGASRQERITGNDLRMLMVALVTMPFFFILAVATVQVYSYADAKSDKALQALQISVMKKFSAEVDLAVSQLKWYDALVDSAHLTMRKTYEDNAALIAKQKGNTLKDLFFYPTIYKNLDDIYWVDGKGLQIAKWFFLNNPVSYLDVSQRSFFQIMRDGRAFVKGSDTFYVEPAISWATGEYAVNILTTSNQTFSNVHVSKRAILIGMAARLYSVCNPVVPKGYNFCIIDGNGRILFHSETERSLHENLFDESNRDFELMNAVAKRDSILLPDGHLFDRDVKMLVSPVRNMPSLTLVNPSCQLSDFSKSESDDKEGYF